MHSSLFEEKQAAIVTALKQRAREKGAALQEELRNIAASKGPDMFWDPSLETPGAGGPSCASRLFSGD